MIPVVEMLRVSTESQAGEGRAGLAAQHAANVRTCAQYGLQVVQAFEIVEGGSEVADSPEMASILEIVKQGRASGIVLAEYSRLFRPDRWSDFKVLQTLSDHHAQIYLPSGPIDLQTELGFIHASVNNMLAGMERRRIAERMNRGKEEHRKRGAHVAGGVGIPFGLSWSKQSGWQYTDDIERIREAFRRFIAGERNFAQLGAELGITRTNLRFMLQNPVYSGWRVYDEKRDMTAAGVRTTTRDRKSIARAPEEVIRVRLPLEPVVSEDEFRLVQELIREKQARQTPRDSCAHLFPYRGFLYCGDAACGEVQYGHANKAPTDGRMLRRYACKRLSHRHRYRGLPCSNGYMLTHRLHPVLDQVLTEKLASPDVIVAAIDAYNASLGASWRTSGPDKGVLQRKQGALTKKRDRVLEAFFEGVISREERDVKLGPIANEVDAIERMLCDENVAQVSAPAAEQLIELVVTTFAEWRFLEDAQKQRLLGALQPKISVYRYEVLGATLPIPDHGTDNHSPTADAVAISSRNFKQDNRSGLYIPLGEVA